MDFSNLFARPAQHGSPAEQLQQMRNLLTRQPAQPQAALVDDAVAPLLQQADDAAAAVAAQHVAAAAPAPAAPAAGGVRNLGLEDIGNLFRRGPAVTGSGAGAAAASAADVAADVAPRAGAGIRNLGLDDLGAMLARGTKASPAAGLVDDAAGAVAKAGLMDDLLNAAKMISKINPRG